MSKSTENKETILQYLEMSYEGAKAMDDVETMIRLHRAILAFSYDDFDHLPSWDEMQDAYIAKDFPAYAGHNKNKGDSNIWHE